MAMKYGKREIGKVVDVLDSEHETVDQAALACLAAMEEIFEERAKFVTVGQVIHTRDKGKLEPGDPDAVKVSLGFHSTEGDARSAAEGLWSSTASGDELVCWVLPVFHGTPAAWHLKQRDKYAAEEAKRAEKAREKVQQSIEKRRVEAQARADGGKGSCEECGHQPYDHRTDGSGRGKCGLTGCVCAKWKEKAKQ